MKLSMNLYDALTSISVPPNKAKAVVNAWESDMEKFATKSDLFRTETQLQASITELGSEVRSLGTELRALINEQGVELRASIKEQGAELRESMTKQGAELREAMTKQGAELRESMTKQSAELREAMGKVSRPIQRIHVPAELSLHPLARAFFAVYSMLGKRLAQPGLDQLLHRPVCHRHQVNVALVLGLDALGKKLAQLSARLARNLRGLGDPYQFLLSRRTHARGAHACSS